jgi:hypothetical protein
MTNGSGEKGHVQRCASPFAVAPYAKSRLTPKDRERNPEAPPCGATGRDKTQGFFLTGDSTSGGR